MGQGLAREAAISNERLLRALAEHMKLPFLQIARQAELTRTIQDFHSGLAQIELTADTALKLLDGYLLGVQLLHKQQVLELEPVSISSVLHDTAHELHKLGEHYHCDVELHMTGRYTPVMAHKGALESALTSLGLVFLEAQTARVHESRSVLKLAAHRSKNGIVTGVFADTEGLSSGVFRRARSLYGRSRQPMGNFSPAASAGVFVAESIFSAMATPLRIAHHQKLTGLAATLRPSRQLNLV